MCCVAQFMVILDLSIVNVALPSIQSSLKFSASDLQWVVDAYAIVFAGFLMLAGRAGDLWGQRRTFVAALPCSPWRRWPVGSRPTSGVLIGARALQGLAGALMAASSLAIITASFERRARPSPRGRAVGRDERRGRRRRDAAGRGDHPGAQLALGPAHQPADRPRPPRWWPAAVVADRRSEKRTSFDLAGALLLTVGLLARGLRGRHRGQPRVGLRGGAGAHRRRARCCWCLFPVVEKRFARAPLVPPKAFTGALRDINIIVLLFSAALFPMWYVGSLYLQQVLALTPLETGLVFLPMALTIFACASQAGKLAPRPGCARCSAAG